MTTERCPNEGCGLQVSSQSARPVMARHRQRCDEASVLEREAWRELATRHGKSRGWSEARRLARRRAETAAAR